MNSRQILGNTLGAFSDAAILFPLLVLLERSQGFSIGTALFSTGLMYLISAAYFRVPMSVQPLKSIAVASIAVGATFTEIRIAAFLLGSICFLTSFFNVNALARKVPESIIHQLQLGLGILLVTQGVYTDFAYAILLLAIFMVLLPEIKGVPVLGLVAAGGLIYSMVHAVPRVGESYQVLNGALRPALIVSLLIPQLVLTSANSVLATRNVCERYYGRERAWRVTVRRLLISIGLGNIVVSLFGGMPFCHGSGGVTAHVRGGSTHAASTALMGVVLLIFSGFYWIQGSVPIVYPPVLIGSLLVATGFFHFKLALPTARTQVGTAKLFMAFVLIAVTRDLLWVFAGAVIFEFLTSEWMKKRVHI